MDVNRTTLSIAAGVAGTLFLGYCIYFDKKRRSDPEYKKKIRERRFPMSEGVVCVCANIDQSNHLNNCVLRREAIAAQDGRRFGIPFGHAQSERPRSRSAVSTAKVV